MWDFIYSATSNYVPNRAFSHPAGSQSIVLLAADRYPDVPTKHLPFRKYPFFIWERCPHVRRLREEGKSITRRHAKIQRQRLKKHQHAVATGFHSSPSTFRTESTCLSSHVSTSSSVLLITGGYESYRMETLDRT